MVSDAVCRRGFVWLFEQDPVRLRCWHVGVPRAATVAVLTQCGGGGVGSGGGPEL